MNSPGLEDAVVHEEQDDEADVVRMVLGHADDRGTGAPSSPLGRLQPHAGRHDLPGEVGRLPGGVASTPSSTACTRSSRLRGTLDDRREPADAEGRAASSATSS